MAAIFKRYPDELHIYHNRMPKKDGRNPWLLWPMFAGILFAFRFGILMAALGAALFLDGAADILKAEIAREPGQHLFDLALTCILGAFVCGQFTKLVFSAKTGTVYWSFLFFRRRLAAFADIADITVRDRNLILINLHSYVMIRRSGMLDRPIPISPVCKNFNRLARYYHEIVPALRTMLALPEAGMAASRTGAVEEVEVMEISVHSGDAPSVSAGMAPTPATDRDFKYFIGQDGKYRSRTSNGGWLLIPTALFFLVWLAVAVVLSIHVHPLFLALAIPSAALLWLSTSDTYYITLDGPGRLITLHTHFGLKQSVFSLDQLQKIRFVRAGPLKALDLALAGRKNDPTLFTGLRQEKIEAALGEFGDIMGIDAKRWLNV